MESNIVMNTNRKRLAFVSGTALTLVLTGASLVSAQTPSSTSTAVGGDTANAALHGPGMGDMGGRGFGGRGGMDGGPRGDLGGGILGRIDNLVSQTTVTLDPDGNVLTSVVQHGTVTAVADGSISIDLATGDSVTVATDANTSAYSWSLSDRPARTETAIADIAVGADVIVWSDSQSDGSFLASRITVVPAAATDTTVTPEASPAAG
jgi:preprotein translocase subunit YajC